MNSPIPTLVSSLQNIQWILFPKTKSTLKGRFGTIHDIQKNEQQVLKVILKEIWGVKGAGNTTGITKYIASYAVYCDVLVILQSDLVCMEVVGSVGIGMLLCALF